MASITNIGKRYRALVRRGGTTRCMTFGTKQMAQNWAATIEGEIEQLKASGFLKPSGLTVGDLIDGYTSTNCTRSSAGRRRRLGTFGF